MKKIVVGKSDNPVFKVKKGQKCIVLKSFFENGEGWYLLEDIKTKTRFESPDMFWE